MDELSISHMRASHHWFIDGTFYKPDNFVQLMIIEYKDVIIKEKIPGAFMITNNKKTCIYKELLTSIKNIISQNNEYILNLESITSDDEKALVKAINYIFPEIIRINCFFHYKKDLRDYFKALGFTKKKFFFISTKR